MGILRIPTGLEPLDFKGPPDKKQDPVGYDAYRDNYLGNTAVKTVLAQSYDEILDEHGQPIYLYPLDGPEGQGVKRNLRVFPVLDASGVIMRDPAKDAEPVFTDKDGNSVENGRKVKQELKVTTRAPLGPNVNLHDFPEDKRSTSSMAGSAPPFYDGRKAAKQTQSGEFRKGVFQDRYTRRSDGSYTDGIDGRVVIDSAGFAVDDNGNNIFDLYPHSDHAYQQSFTQVDSTPNVRSPFAKQAKTGELPPYSNPEGKYSLVSPFITLKYQYDRKDTTRQVEVAKFVEEYLTEAMSGHGHDPRHHFDPEAEGITRLATALSAYDPNNPEHKKAWKNLVRHLSRSSKNLHFATMIRSGHSASQALNSPGDSIVPESVQQIVPIIKQTQFDQDVIDKLSEEHEMKDIMHGQAVNRNARDVMPKGPTERLIKDLLTRGTVTTRELSDGSFYETRTMIRKPDGTRILLGNVDPDDSNILHVRVIAPDGTVITNDKKIDINRQVIRMAAEIDRSKKGKLPFEIITPNGDRINIPKTRMPRNERKALKKRYKKIRDSEHHEHHGVHAMRDIVYGNAEDLLASAREFSRVVNRDYDQRIQAIQTHRQGKLDTSNDAIAEAQRNGTDSSLNPDTGHIDPRTSRARPHP